MYRGKWLVYVDRSLGGDFDAILGPSKLGDVNEIPGIWGKWLVYMDKSLEGDFDAIFGPSKLGDVTEIPGIWENGWYMWTGLWKVILMQYLDPRN